MKGQKLVSTTDRNWPDVTWAFSLDVFLPTSSVVLILTISRSVSSMRMLMSLSGWNRRFSGTLPTPLTPPSPSPSPAKTSAEKALPSVPPAPADPVTTCRQMSPPITKTLTINAMSSPKMKRSAQDRPSHSDPPTQHPPKRGLLLLTENTLTMKHFISAVTSGRDQKCHITHNHHPFTWIYGR